MSLKKTIVHIWTTKKIWLIIAILVLITGIGYYFFYHRNIFSKDKIFLQILEPKKVVSGEKTTWFVNFKNKSNTTIENLTLTIEYPSGVFAPDGGLKKREKKTYKRLLPLEEKTESFSGIIFGKRDEVKKTKVALIYNPAGLSAKFKNEAFVSTLITNTSVVFEMQLPPRVNSDEEFTITLNYQSGFSFLLEDFQLRFSPPEEFERLSPKLENEEKEDGKIIFNIGALDEREGGKIEIRGRLKGEIGEEKLFKAEFGRFEEKLYEFIPLASSEKIIKIISSYLDIFRKINGDYDYFPKPGETLSYIIEFKNTGEDVYRDLNLIIDLESEVLDFTTLKIAGGKIEKEVSQINKIIIFSAEDFPFLSFLGPYGEGRVGFEIKLKDYNPSFYIPQGLIKEKITLGKFEKEFQTRISSATNFSQKIYYNLEKLPEEIKNKFKNEDPSPNEESSPLKTNKEITLTAVWEVKNMGNELSEVKIITILPENTFFLGNIYPEGTNIIFTETTRELILNIENLPSYLPSQIFAFQIKVIPKTSPYKIMEETKLKGKDNWTNKIFEISNPPILNQEII